MILPKKQLPLNESLFGFGAFLLKHIWTPISMHDLWEYYKNSYDTQTYPVKFSFDQFIMTLDYLYIIGAIKENERGLLCYEAA